jgi:hypothetical protein
MLVYCHIGTLKLCLEWRCAGLVVGQNPKQGIEAGRIYEEVQQKDYVCNVHGGAGERRELQAGLNQVRTRKGARLKPRPWGLIDTRV